jgi:dTDP-4-amino-4,6-dideoxygalactose transaminase
MEHSMKPFDKPLYVSRPVLPDIEAMTEKLKEIWESKWLTNKGAQHDLLERELTSYLKIPYLSLFNNGTIALIAACRALRLSGEVITTPFTFPATPHVLTWNNIRPIFCDIEPESMNIDANKIESMITSDTTAILGVHVFGRPCGVRKIQETADYYGLKVIYDAAHAFGVEIDGDGIGNFGDISMLSFHATKMYHTAEGGALLLKDPALKSRIEFLKNFGIKNEEQVVMPGINGKMSEIHAALGLLVLRLVDREIENRKIMTGVYRANLAEVEGIILPGETPNVKNNYQYFVIRIDEKLFGRPRDYVHDKLKEYNVFSRKYFYPLCSEYTCYRHLPSSAPENLPVAAKVSKEVLCLPLYGELSIDDVSKISSIIKSLKHS